MYQIEIHAPNHSVSELLEFPNSERMFAEAAFDHIRLNKGEYVEMIRYPENTNYAFILESRCYYR